MAYIQPDSEIQFFSDLGLSQDYNDSLYFASLADKDAYFSNSDFRLATVTKCTYTRERRGFVRVELPMSTLIHAQYMRFKNTSFENKWWYAFVTDVVYINNITTEVQFEIDPLMSWMGAFSLSQCFVERQHSETDGVGENIVEENLETGDYLYSYRQPSGIFTPEDGYNDAWVYIMWFAPDSKISGSILQGLYDNIYSGASYYVTTNANDMTSKINELTGLNLADNIIAIRMIPAKMIPEYHNDNEYHEITPRTVSFRRIIDGWYGNYTPRNNKMYTYPYNFLTVFNSEGDKQEYKYEFFGTQPPLTSEADIEFSFYSNGGIQPKLMCVPRNYLGQVECYPYSLTMQSFPMCSWNVDGFKAYMAQMESSLPTQMLSSGLNSVVRGASYGNVEGAIAGGAVGAVTPIVNLMSNYITHPTMPSAIKGQGVSDAYVTYRKKDFYFYRTTIDEAHCRMIDNFFTMYGYAQKTVRVPNMHARQRYTYVKTQACKINCLCPSADADFIENLFNRGIRFWTNHEYIGDYATANLPLT